MKLIQFYMVEKKIKDLPVEKRQKARLKESLPLVKAYFVWLEQKKKEVLPKSKLGEAISYSLNQREPLLVPFSTGNLELDNNRADRSIKPFTIGRKNWLFSNSSKGADSSALVYSVIETAKENQLKVFEYLVHLFQTLPNIDLEEIDCHLPWSASLPAKCYLDRQD
jgi:transposase